MLKCITDSVTQQSSLTGRYLLPDKFKTSPHAAFPAQQSHNPKLTARQSPHHQHLKIAR
jgi:hypothetical protein